MSEEQEPNEGMSNKVKSAVELACLYPMGFAGFQLRKAGHLMGKAKICRWMADGVSNGYDATRRNYAKRVLLSAYNGCAEANDIREAINNAKVHLIKMGTPFDELEQICAELKHEFQQTQQHVATA